MGWKQETRALRILRVKAALLSVFGFFFLYVLSVLLVFLQDSLQAIPAWLTAASAAWLYLSFLLWKNLPENETADKALSAGLGLANLITILRGLLMSAFAGFIVFPQPEGDFAWLPGSLYLAAALPDFVDGIIARRTGRATRLGEILDLNVDSIGVLAAVTVAVKYGIVPLWYLSIGLARYIFVFGIRLRERLGLPVHELPPSVRRRGFAALSMGFLFVILFPPFRPPATTIGAAAFGLPIAAGFLWDWGLVTGRIKPGKAGLKSPAVRWVLDWVPLALRVGAVILGAAVISRHLADPAARAIGFLEIGAVALIALGIAAHTAGILAVFLLGLSQNLVPLDAAGSLLVFLYIGIIFLGSGRFSLLPVEDRLIHHRIGDPG